MSRVTCIAIFILFFWGLTACVTTATPSTPTPTVTPAPTGTLTPTIVWFPPTATNTPLPTVTSIVTPTQDTSPTYGTAIFSDDFSDPGAWMLGRSPNGSMALGVNEITLAVSQERGYLFSLRQEPILSDFYLEITASPSICRGEDEYGLLIRVSPSLEFFRFSLLCNGQARVDRYYQDKASSPQSPTPYGAVPPGAPSTSRIAVWAVGREMRFYANGVFLFAINDPTLRSGSLGVFARASGENALTVNFSDLVVYEAAK